MLIMILQSVPVSARGELSRWMLEPHPGVFVGQVNALVRERLWLKCCAARGVGGVLQVWNTNNEQGFKMRSCGDLPREICEIEGLQLVLIPTPPAIPTPAPAAQS